MQPVPAPTPPTSPSDSAGRVIPQQPKQAAIVVLGFTAVLYLIELIDSIAGHALDAGGILPRQWSGLDGVLWAPLLHFGWGHLAANTVPILVLGFLSMAGGLGQFLAVTGTIWLISGLGTWVTGSYGIHLGASGLIFGWLVFLLVRGLLLRRFVPILLSVALFFYYGYMLWGVLPGQEGISWQGHLFGAIGGLVAGWLVTRNVRKPAAPAAA